MGDKKVWKEVRRAAASSLETEEKEEPLIRYSKCKGHIRMQTIKSQGTTCTNNRKCVQMYERFGLESTL